MRNVLAVISGIFSYAVYAVDDEILKFNPAFGIGRNLRKVAKAQESGFKADA
jgi:hypothetical protein